MARQRYRRFLTKTAFAFVFGALFLETAFGGRAFSQTAQEAHVSGSPNPVGSGARALGMGGAFIGVADDATAASWNPGGLIQLETPEMSLVLSYDKWTEKRAFKDTPGASGEHDISLYDINYLSLAYPFQYKNYNMIISVNYQTLYNFHRSNNYAYDFDRLSKQKINEDTTISTILGETVDHFTGPRQTSLNSCGYLKALSPAFAIQVTPKLSFGFTMNWFHPELGSEWQTTYTDYYKGFWDKTTDITTTFKTFPIPPVKTVLNSRYKIDEKTYYHDEYRFRTSFNPMDIFAKEVSYNVGFLWNINSVFTLGGVYKAPYKAVVQYLEVFRTKQHAVNVANPLDETRTDTGEVVIADERQIMEMPRSYGLGLACRFSDQFTMDLDVYRTDWQHFVLRQADGRELSLITGQERTQVDTKPTHQVRLGAEYLFYIKKKYVAPLRAGLFYDPEPTENEPDDFYGFSLGGGIAAGPFVFDIAYQYRWGNDVRKVRLAGEECFQDVRQHTIYYSLIYHF